MAFVIPPTFNMPMGNAQMLAALGQDLIDLSRGQLGDEQRDQMLKGSAAVAAADAQFRNFWLGEAADRFSRSAIASRDRIRATYRAAGKGGATALTLANAIATAQVAIAQAQQTAQARAHQAALDPIPRDPYTLWGDLWSYESGVTSTLAEAHREATSDWNRLTRSAPNYVAPKPKPAETKRPWWKKAIGVTHIILDGAGLVPVLGEPADGINALIYLAEGDKLNATLSGGAMVPGPTGWAATGIKWGNKADNAADAVRAASNTSDVAKGENLVNSVGGTPPSGGSGSSGWNNGDPARPNNPIDGVNPDRPLIEGVGGARGDAGYDGGNYGWGGGPRDAQTGAGQLTPPPPSAIETPRPVEVVVTPPRRPNPFRGVRPSLPTIVFPRPAFGGPAMGMA